MLVILNILSVGIGATYSYFRSDIKLSSNNINFAKFIFNSSVVESFELPLDNLFPGSNNEYLFSVTNNERGTVSDVDTEYIITIKTYHFIPLDITLYSIEDEAYTLVLDCNEEEYDRDDKNVLICSTDSLTLNYDTMKTDEYKLAISFPSEYNDLEYQNLVDFIELNINSEQKRGN